MSRQEIIKIFGDRKIRSVWDDEAEIWYFSIVDVVAVLTESKDSLAYWRKLKQRLKAEGNETVTNCHGLKLRAADGKMRMTDEWKARSVYRADKVRPAILRGKIISVWESLTFLKGILEEKCSRTWALNAIFYCKRTY